MALLLHVQGTNRSPLHPFDGHLVRNLRWDRFGVEDVTADVDALVVSADDGESGESLIRLVRASGHGTPVLLRDPSEPGHRLEAEDLAVAGEDPALLSRAVQLLLPDEFWSDEGAPASDERETVIDLRRHVPRGGGRQLLRERLGEAGAIVGASARAFDLRATEPEPAPGSHTDPPARPVVADDDPPPAPGTPTVPEPTQPEPSPAPRGRDRRNAEHPDALVERLLMQVDRLYGVHETAMAVAAHLRDTVVVDAAAVLVPDRDRWLVAGAVGHRHLEERLVVGPEHWLVAEVCSAHHGLIVEDTDIARSRLAGAPLSAWPHLMAAPIPSVAGIALMARDEGGPHFTARDLAKASEALGEADALFGSAVRLRELARRLSSFADLDDLDLTP